MIDDAERQLAGDHQSNGDAPEGNAGQKIVGAVDRIDDPDGRGIRVARAALLAEKAVLGERLGQARDDQVFADPVGVAHQILRTFPVDVKQLAPGKMVGRDTSGLAHDGFGHAQTVVELGRFHGHAAQPALPAR